MPKREFQISVLEDAAGAPRSAAEPRWHVVVQQPGQDKSEALDLHGRDRIGEQDAIIFAVAVDPGPDAEADDPASCVRFLLPPIDTAQDAQKGGAALLDAVSDGGISADEALPTMALLVAQADLISAGDHERRLAALEEQFRRRR